jgi:peptidoglycan/xylan/chitin deacetylase (PgdA/CDA1 family)
MLFAIDRHKKARLILIGGLFALLILARLVVLFDDGHLVTATRLKPVRQINTDVPAVALTFDLAYGEDTLPLLLKTLREQSIPATFFLSGSWASAHPALVDVIQADGHTIGTLGYSGGRLCDLGAAVLQAELSSAIKALAAQTGHTPQFFRPPDGACNDDLVQVATEQGLLTILWTVEAAPGRVRDSEALVHRVVARVRPGAIIRLRADDGAYLTYAALPELITALKAHGLCCLALPDLFAAAID